MIGQIITIVICLIAGIGVFIYKKIEENNIKKCSADNKASDFVNVKKIEKDMLYTKDGFVMSYLKIEPVSIDLYSENEKKTLARGLTAELSHINKPFKLICVSKHVDISNLISEYEELLSKSDDPVQKNILRKEILMISDFVSNEEVTERQFFICMWVKYKKDIEMEFRKQMMLLKENFETNKIKCKLQNKGEIISLCNLINNPSYVHLDKE